jgi:predicted RNA-binding protein Jag
MNVILRHNQKNNNTMAKVSAKTETSPKKSVAKPKAKSSSVNIEKVSEDILSKLQTLNIEHQLQADLEWCLGSYRFDKNPSGLLEVIGKAGEVLKAAHAKKTKGVTATLISSIEKVLK